MVWVMASVLLWTVTVAVLAGGGNLQPYPQRTVMTDFNMTKYLGEWNEILRLPNVHEESYSCMQDVFSLAPDGTTKVLSHAYNVSNHAYDFLEGVATEPEPGRFDITYSGETVWSSSYWVLATNYDAYAVLWGSLLEGDAPMPLAWVLSRQKTLGEEYGTEVNQVLRNNGLQRSQFEGVDQTNCPEVTTADN
ncbi:Apolipoprotein D [Cryptotermes secundus]|uniref:Apolipoprotein D n=1 Tax=Cryptotermes secundus TaxID=105785 RepID=A0A2J7Q860_9NEOP|nr:apolipoprotein D [Cryptotermes secundus]PNF24762.1 Apolipoprotein D [Cryptotermes secundus]